MTTQAEKYIENSLALAPDNLKNIDAKYVNVIICYKFEDGSEAEFDGTYIAKTGQCRWYSTKITNTKCIVAEFHSRVNDIYRNLFGKNEVFKPC
jgi:hypothetical protein